MFRVVSFLKYIFAVNIFFILLSSFSYAQERDPVTGLPIPEGEYKYNKLDDVKDSLTTSYIDSMRAGKWGASDPDWVNLDLAKSFFQDAALIGFLEGDIPTVSVMSGEDLNTGEDLLGYMFMTRDITMSRGFSSQIFDIVVGVSS